MEVDPNNPLKYTPRSPVSGSADTPENYHTVSFDLVAAAKATRLTLAQSNNPSQTAADAMAKNAWGPMLQDLKTVVEA